ncbi:MAG: 5'-nucleotidase C-terminal domain-containing protein [Spirochaetaceae bacterium]|jgi:5'-nucleotidase/UDP-sugar diphosphatase|nr:5'-nucleotidase C-terminal domain-containing protein [Spirochaetaceae bacterium]
MKKYQKFLCVAVAFAVALFFAACSKGIKPVPRDPNLTYELTVLHTNDHHGTTLSKDGKMGLAERSSFVKGERASHSNILILDAGDLNTGTALSNMFDAEPDIKAYNIIGYKAVALGNHEFDKPLTTLQRQIAESDFSWLSANIKKDDGSYLVKPYIIQDYEGFRVAVIGLTTLRTLETARPDSSLKWIPEIDAAKEMVRIVRDKEKADIVIILGHIGNVLESDDQTTSPMICEALANDGLQIDLFIDGHSHSDFTTPLVVAGVPIVTAWEWGNNVGDGLFEIKDGKVVSFTWRPIHITSDEYPPDEEVLTLLAPYIAQADDSLKEVVLKTSGEFIFEKGSISRISRYEESASGDLVADSFVWYLNTVGVPCDFSITNGGGIRSALPKGDVTREAIKTMLPFDNWLYVVKLKGSDVREVFNNAAALNQGAGGFLQVSKNIKLSMVYDANGANGKVTSIEINGAPIDDNKIYSIATNDYLADGGDGYTVLKDKRLDFINTSMFVTDVVINYAASIATLLAPTTDGRITIAGGVSIR